MPHSLHSSSARADLERAEADAEVTAFAAGLSRDVERDTLGFLARLNGRLFSDFTRVIRDTGNPQAPVNTMPITGSFLGDGVTSALDFSLEILAEEG